MRYVKQALINKIKNDLSLNGLEHELTKELVIIRPTLSWNDKTSGRMIWYWLIRGNLIGSSEKMTELLKSNKLEVYKPDKFTFEISSS